MKILRYILCILYTGPTNMSVRLYDTIFYLGKIPKSNWKNSGLHKSKAMLLSPKTSPHFSALWLQFQREKATWMTHNCGVYIQIFIHVHKQFLFSWVDQWVSDKWYLSSFIHWLRIHGVCWIGKNKSIFKQLKNIGQGSLSKPAIIPLACVLRYLG